MTLKPFLTTWNTRHFGQFAIGHPIDMCARQRLAQQDTRSSPCLQVALCFDGHVSSWRWRSRLPFLFGQSKAIQYSLKARGPCSGGYQSGRKAPPGSLIPPLLPPPNGSSAKKRKGKKSSPIALLIGNLWGGSAGTPDTRDLLAALCLPVNA